MFIIQRKLLIFFIFYFVLQLFLTQNHTLTADEGTHALIGLFYKDVIFNLQNFHSIQDVMNFATDYIVKYPKISPFYPPLYHLLLMLFFSLTESLLVVKVFNILLIILTSLIIYKICEKLLKDKNAAVISSIFFLSFSIVFYNADKVMMDGLQILTFSIVVFYYLNLKDKRTVSKSEILKLSILLALAFLTKYFSIFLPLIILCDSFFRNRRLFKYFLFSVILSLIIISPYLFFYVKFNFHKLLFKIGASPYLNHLVYFDIFLNFGVFIGFFIVFSVIWFIWKNLKNPLIVTWFFTPFILFFMIKGSSERYAFILMPIYALSCGFIFQKIQGVHSRQKKNLLIGLVLTLIGLQLVNNIYNNYQDFVYPIDNLMKPITKNGNILIMSEEPIYSSVYILYGYLNNVKGNLFRPCIIEKYKLSKEFLGEWGIQYLIDQNNTITKEMEKSLNLKIIKSLKVKDGSLWLFETNVKNSVDCNFVCSIQGKVCKGEGFRKILSLINSSTSSSFE